MTDLHTAARQALEALEDVCERLAFVCGEKDASAPSAVGRAKAAALRAALEAQQEPVAELLAELDGERNRSQMYADLVRGVAVVLHGPGWSDTSKLPEEVARLRAEVEALRKDAERYRWLRQGYATLLLRYFPSPDKYLQASDVLDAAIDAAKTGD